MQRVSKKIYHVINELQKAINDDKSFRARQAWVNGIKYAILKLEDGYSMDELKQFVVTFCDEHNNAADPL